MLKKIINSIMNLFSRPSQQDILDQEALCKLVQSLLKFLEDYHLTTEEKISIITQARIALTMNKNRSDLHRLASQILDALEDNNLTIDECTELKRLAYKYLLDYRFDES